ncbi:hypothetical protein TCON_2817 [Astathelohania contejeani]|uniref:PiggyBac transposable element-derived protein 4 C-terminal zinc-ribbon domain-containing protein n=1 Tax=Astathelohania contejeani TaxID=164912 RepID=A0ABQ7HUX7_9MICR|nr:hypothetical protein TCON_2817 [Thelohania contejeani]
MIHNTYILYKTFCNQENKLNTHLKFRIALINHFTQTTLLNNITPKNPITRKLFVNSLKNPTITDHLPSKYPSGKSRRCNYCLGAKRRKTLYYCLKCNKSLCIDGCYMSYHERLEVGEELNSSTSSGSLFESEF